LERRMLLSLSPAGPEFRVNTFTTNTQGDPAIAADGDGDFVVAWQSIQEGTGGPGIFAQRYNASGVPQGGELHVNTFTPSTQANPAIAMDADGDFIVAWSSTDAVNGGVRAQRFNAAGVPQGTEFGVAPSAGQGAGQPAVGMDVAGNFVVAYSANEGASGVNILVRRYDFLGAPQGTAFRANTYLTSVQLTPAVAMDADGDFVVAWESYLQDGSDYGVYAQRFNSFGNVQGAEFRVNSYTTSTQRSAAVGMDLAGDFVVAWHSYGQDGSSNGVYAQRYNAAGIAQGAEFRVNTFTTNGQSGPVVALDADGDFLITWSSYQQDGSLSGIYAQQYSAAGATIGAEFKVNSFTTNSQTRPAVTADHKGDYVIAWDSNTQEGGSGGIGVYAQRYLESTDTAGPIVAGVFVNGQRVLPYSTQLGLQQIVISFSENMDVTGGPSGPNSVTNPANWLLTRNGLDIISDISSITFGFNATTNRYEAVLNLSTSQTSGNFLVLARDTLRDAAGNALDGDADGAPGGSFALPFSVTLAHGAEFRVNTYTTQGQAGASVASSATGDFVVAWSSGDQDGSGTGVYAQRYNAAGAAQGAEFKVNTYTTNNQSEVSVAMDSAGDFVVAWQSNGQDGSSYGIYAQRYSAAGTAQGAEFKVNTFTPGTQRFPTVAMDSAGDFVVAWESFFQDGSAYGIYAQRYNAAGAAQGSEFKVNTYTTDFQTSAAVAMDSAGDFVVAWQSFGQDGSGDGTYAQRYNAAGAAQGAEFKVNTYTTNHQDLPSVAMDSAGDFVVAWQSYLQDGSLDGIYAQRYNPAGAAQGPEFKVNTQTTNRKAAPSVAMDSTGDFVAAWHSFGQDGSGAGNYSQRYNAAAAAQGAEFKVNTYTTSTQFGPSVAMDSAGDFVVAWQSNGQDGSSYGVYAQRYGVVDRTPSVEALTDSPDPVAAGDTITLNASNVTDDGTVTNVSFYRESNGVAGLQVGFQGDTLVGTDTTPSAGVWSIDVDTTALAAGTYTYWAQATDDAGLIGKPASTTNQVQSSFPLNLAPHRLLFAFNANVSASLGTDDIVLQNLTTMQTIPSNQLSLSYNLQTNVATFTYIGPGTESTGVLPDGNYRATLVAAGITDPHGVPLPADIVYNFFFLQGDANHDAAVNLLDFNILATNFGQSNRDFSQGDFNYDGSVNLLDFNILAARFGTSLCSGAFSLTKITSPSQQRLIDTLRQDLLA
jgi:hypothetical protein